MIFRQHQLGLPRALGFALALLAVAFPCASARDLEATRTPAAHSSDGQSAAKLAHWQPSPLSEGFDPQQATPTSEGVIRGRVTVIDPGTERAIPISAVTLYLVRDGQVTNRVLPGADGEFRFTDVKPGYYSIVAAGQDGFMAFAVQLMARGAVRAAALPRFMLVSARRQPNASLAIGGVAVPPSNFNALKRLLLPYFRTRTSVAPLLAPRDAPADPSPAAPNAAEAVPAPEAAAGPARVPAVHLQSDGRLVGRVRRLSARPGERVRVQRTRVFVLKNDQIAAQAPVDRGGSFSVNGLNTGSYSLVALGNDGFTAFSFRALAASRDAANRPRSLAALVSHRMADDGDEEEMEAEVEEELDVPLTDPRDLDTILRIANSQLPGGLESGDGVPLAAASGNGNGAGSSGGGGGGGGGGGFGLGGGGALAGVAAVVAGAAASSSSESGFESRMVDRPLATPFRPQPPLISETEAANAATLNGLVRPVIQPK